MTMTDYYHDHQIMNYFVWCFCTCLLTSRPVTTSESSAEVHYNVSLSLIEDIRIADASVITKHPTKPNSLLLGGVRALYTLNLNTKISEIIAGNIIATGYREGEGAHALFNNIQGLLAVNSSTLIVSDTRNTCLRIIDLNNHKTSRYAGKCDYSGTHDYSSRDGNRLNEAHFFEPRGLLQTKAGIYVADAYKLRLVNDSEVITLLSFQDWNMLNCLLEAADGYIYITHYAGLARYDPITGDPEPLIGGNTQNDVGFRDGPFTIARFNQAFGILALAPGLFLLVDGQNHVMRLVDMDRNVVRTICSKDSIILFDESVNDTLSPQCTENLPYVASSIVSVGDYIYVSEWEIGVRKFLHVQATIANDTATVTMTTPANGTATETTIATGDHTTVHTAATKSENKNTNEHIFPSQTRNQGHTTPISTSSSAVASTLITHDYTTSAFIRTWSVIASTTPFLRSTLREIKNSTMKEQEGKEIFKVHLVIGLATAGGVTFFVISILAGFFIRRFVRKRSDGFQPLIDDTSNNSDRITDSNYIILTENRTTTNHRVVQQANRPLPELPIDPDNYYELCNHPDSVYLEADDDNDNKTNGESDDEYTGPYIAGSNTQQEDDPVSSTTPASVASSDDVTAVDVTGDHDLTDDVTIYIS